MAYSRATYDAVPIVTFAILAAVWLAAIGGWIANIVKFVGAFAEPVTGLEIVRGIGIIFMPIGAVLGFL